MSVGPRRRSLPVKTPGGILLQRLPLGVWAILAGWGCCSLTADAAGFVPSEQLLPATTRAWASASDAPALRARFDRSALGSLLDDPLMRPFLDSLEEQRSTVAGDRLGFGITPQELSAISGGETAIAAVEQADGMLAGLLLVDTTGHDEKVGATLETVFARLIAKGSRKLAAPEGITAFELPPVKPLEGAAVAAEPGSPRRLVYASVPGAIVVGTTPEAVAALLPTLAAGRPDALGTLEPFKAVMERTTSGVPDEAPRARWFIDPLAYAVAQQKSGPAKKPTKRKPTDYVAMAKRNGFDCIKGAGGVVFFGEGSVDLRHNTHIHAPPTASSPKGTERYLKAARILEFPNASALEPAPWVPGDAASWLGLQWDVPKVFRALEPLVDDIVGEPGVFDDVISSLKEDPDGPQIDVENDFIKHLGGAVMITGDHVLPFGPDCERMLIAIATNDPAAVAATIAKSMATEANTKRIEIGDHIIWETVPDESGAAGRSTRVRAGRDDDDDRPRGQLGDPDSSPFPNAAVAVAHGHILIASHRDLLERVLQGKSPSFAAEPDYTAAVEELRRILPGDVALRTFGRTEQMVQPTYELLRAGKGPENKSLSGRIANALLSARENPGSAPGTKKPKEPRRPRVDGTTLPEFEKIRRYFGTAGMTMQTVPDGWMFVGASLWDRANAAAVAADGAADANGAAVEGAIDAAAE